MSNNDDDTATPVPRFRDAQVDRTVVHPNLSSSSSLHTLQQHTLVVAADTQLGMTEQSRSWAREVDGRMRFLGQDRLEEGMTRTRRLFAMHSFHSKKQNGKRRAVLHRAPSIDTQAGGCEIPRSGSVRTDSR